MDRHCSPQTASCFLLLFLSEATLLVKISLCSAGWSQTLCASQPGLEVRFSCLITPVMGLLGCATAPKCGHAKDV